MRPYNSLVDRGFNRFVTAYNQPGFDFNVNMARLIVCAFLIWKLLSRDFGFFGHVPEQVFYFYPIEILSARQMGALDRIARVVGVVDLPLAALVHPASR